VAMKILMEDADGVARPMPPLRDETAHGSTLPYDAIKALNWSTLKHMIVSPLLYRWRLDNPEPPRKPSFVFGGAVHCAILEPEKFEERYALFDGTRRGKEWDRWEAEHPGVQSLKPDEMERVLASAEAVRKHRVAGPLLRGGRCEEIVTWTDEVTGLACQGRLDYIRPDCVIDLKTTRDPAPRRFERAVADYGYAAQVSLYHDGAVAARLIDGRERPYIVALQNDEPFDVAVFQLEPETLAYGRAIYRSLLSRLLECTSANWWPGVAPTLQPLGISPWAAEPFAIENEEEF
jgi:hypothetical protein